MSADVVPPRYVMSDALRAALRESFDAEVALRLPRLRALQQGVEVDLEEVTRDAHTLGSSAALVGLLDTSHAARRVEVLLATGEPPADALAVLLDLLTRQPRTQPCVVQP